MHVNQQLNFHHQQLYTEARAQEARAEAESRTEALTQMIRSTQIDPVALEQHVNSKLQSAISAANSAAQSEARAAVEARAVQHAHISDVRMAEGSKQVQDQLQENFEQRIREVLSAHMDQVNAQIQLAIATQGKEILRVIQQQMSVYQEEMSAHLVEQAKRTAERKAKWIVRLHHAEEKAAHEAIKKSLLQTMKEFKASTIADTIHHTEKRIQLASKTEAAGMIAMSQIQGSHKPSGISSQPVLSAESVLQVDADAEYDGDTGVCESATLHDKARDFAETRITNQECREIPSRIIQELEQLLGTAKPAPNPVAKVKHEELRAVCRSEQAKVAARAVARSRALVSTAKTPAERIRKLYNGIDYKYNKKRPVSTAKKQIELAVKLRSDERKAIKKKRAEEALKLAEKLLTQLSK